MNKNTKLIFIATIAIVFIASIFMYSKNKIDSRKQYTIDKYKFYGLVM